MSNQLRDHFVGVGVKRLSAVDAEPTKSNQHEVGTTSAMREQFLGATHRREYDVTYIWLGEGQDGLIAQGTATHYDSRLGQADRSPEWRLYYPSTSVTEAMRAGDTLFLALAPDGRLYFIVAAAESTSEQQLLWLFGVHAQGKSFVSRPIGTTGPGLGFAARLILEEIGIDYTDAEGSTVDALVEDFGDDFPRTALFSERARVSLPSVDPRDDPDAALLAWLEREEAMFRCLERRIVTRRLDAGFSEGDHVDVDGFISFSLSVQNRRKSRMGNALENQLEAVFKACDIRYVRGPLTENKQKPDFLFPSLELYRQAPDDGDPRLAMLGAKSSCKERWRQVLAEAAKIPTKHLLTLEPSISEPQTDQMASSSLQLVVPSPIQDTYTEKQRGWLWTLREFINDLGARRLD